MSESQRTGELLGHMDVELAVHQPLSVANYGVEGRRTCIPLLAITISSRVATAAATAVLVEAVPETVLETGRWSFIRSRMETRPYLMKKRGKSPNEISSIWLKRDKEIGCSKYNVM
uniref:Uncharacterized protein n=1 Tax=Vespula pensylvanica TaxID=30213 RepID=A0A834PAI7_VESPE|nr:hypothetical protein H0235_002651 [Vespula pensylvanica]